MGTINTDEDFERVANVSNPLGWDGDIARILRSDRGDRVSNPLGWDGDGLDRGHLAPAADSF